MRVGSLIAHVADAIKEKLEHELAVGRQMNECNDKVTCHIDTCYDKDQSSFRITEDITESFNIAELKIYSCDVVDD